MTDFSTLLYTSSNEIPTLPEEPPCSIGYYRQYPPPGLNFPQGLEERKVIIAVADPGEGPAGLGPPYF